MIFKTESVGCGNKYWVEGQVRAPVGHCIVEIVVVVLFVIAIFIKDKDLCGSEILQNPNICLSIKFRKGLKRTICSCGIFIINTIITVLVIILLSIIMIIQDLFIIVLLLQKRNNLCSSQLLKGQ